MTIALRCVVDASVAIKQFIPDDPLTPKVNQLFARLMTFRFRRWSQCRSDRLVEFCL
jgi:hypothetical protein